MNRAGADGACVSSEVAPAAYFSRTFDEALGLVVEARDYVAGRQIGRAHV